MKTISFPLMPAIKPVFFWGGGYVRLGLVVQSWDKQESTVESGNWDGETGRREVKGWFLVILQRLEIKRSRIESPGGSSFFHHLFEKYVVMLDHFPQGSS